MKNIYFLLVIIFVSNVTTTNHSLAQNVKENSNTQHKRTKVLLLTDNNYGSSFVYGDESTKSIQQTFEDYGWNITLAAPIDTIMPCEWGEKTLGTKPMIITHKISDFHNPSEFDAIIILPGSSFLNLMSEPHVLNFLKKANQEKIVIGAWCRGVRLLAAADIIRGKNIIGHYDYFEEYKAAGANYIEYSFKLENGRKLFTNASPPIKDGNIITTIRSLYYRNEMCQLLKETIEEE